MQYIFAIDYLMALALVFYAAFAGRRKFLVMLFISVLLAFATANIEHASTPLLISGTIIMAFFIKTTGGRFNFIMLPPALFYFFSVIPSIALEAQALLFGMLSGVAYVPIQKAAKKEKRVEISRDIAQIIIGIAAIALFAAMGIAADQTIVLLILLLTCVGSYAMLRPRSAMSKYIAALEREGVALGVGAFWLAFGAVLAISFITNEAYLITVLIALFFGDSLATILGINFGRHTLFYNKNKSAEGTLAFFAIVSILAYPLIGIASLLFAAVAAITETAKIGIDDNISISLVLVLLYYVLYVLHV
ncbi:MAG: hypothetical protein QXS17_01470 [Candidatus Micrarchaeaceae archaeon]